MACSRIIRNKYILRSQRITRPRSINKDCKIISYHYHWLKVDELQLFFFRFCASCYKQFYSYYNPQIILQSLQDFIRERTAAYQRKENEERWKQYEIAQRNAITYEEYERIKPFMGIDKSI